MRDAFPSAIILCSASSPEKLIGHYQRDFMESLGSIEPGLYVGPSQIVEHYQSDEK